MKQTFLHQEYFRLATHKDVLIFHANEPAEKIIRDEKGRELPPAQVKSLLKSYPELRRRVKQILKKLQS